MTRYCFKVLGQQHTITADRVLRWAYGPIVNGQPKPRFAKTKTTAMREIVAMRGDRFLVPVTEA